MSITIEPTCLDVGGVVSIWGDGGGDDPHVGGGVGVETTENPTLVHIHRLLQVDLTHLKVVCEKEGESLTIYRTVEPLGLEWNYTILFQDKIPIPG